DADSAGSTAGLAYTLARPAPSVVTQTARITVTVARHLPMPRAWGRRGVIIAKPLNGSPDRPEKPPRVSDMAIRHECRRRKADTWGNGPRSVSRETERICSRRRPDDPRGTPPPGWGRLRSPHGARVRAVRLPAVRGPPVRVATLAV